MYKLSNEKQAPIGDGYDISIASMDEVIDQARTLKSLLCCKDNDKIESNKCLALSCIEVAMAALIELREAIKDM